MIFDDFENDEDAFDAPRPRLPSLDSGRDSIRLRMDERHRRIRVKDFSSLYRLYHVDVNKIENENASMGPCEPKGQSIRQRSIRNSRASDRVSISIGRRSTRRSSAHHRRFLETHVREDLESNSSEDEHSDSHTCQSNKEMIDEPSHATERIGSICKAREVIEESRDPQTMRRSELRQTVSGNSRPSDALKFRSIQNLESKRAVQSVKRMHSFQGFVFKNRVSTTGDPNARIPSFASLECLEKAPFGVSKGEENTCMACGQLFKFKQTMAETVNCLHRFHKDCLDSALASQEHQESVSCPKCGCLL